jgi:DNA mismatch endonuclease, patch repair protein
MARVRSRDTSPERLVRRILIDLGYRYRLHRADLPGKPDIAFIGRRKAIFVHGCFWHGHDCKRGAREPKANAAYWRAKIARNRARDARSVATIEAMGWRSLTVWECELRDRAALALRLGSFLESDAQQRQCEPARRREPQGTPGSGVKGGDV